jgi:hypothetical protein
LRPRTIVTLALAAPLLATLALVVPGSRTRLLRSAGQALVYNDALAPADMIVLAVDVDGEGVLTAVDLVKAGYAHGVAVFEDPPSAVDLEFMRRGVPHFDQARSSLAELRALGVDATEAIDRPAAGTEDETRILAGWCARKKLQNIIFLSTADHSRRVRRALDRAMSGQSTQVIVRSAMPSRFDPATWWQSRTGLRIGINELAKLGLDLLRHPLG